MYFVDIDRFKLINDSLGHLAGDEVLVGVARRLENALRSLNARLGSEHALARPTGIGRAGTCFVTPTWRCTARSLSAKRDAKSSMSRCWRWSNGACVWRPTSGMRSTAVKMDVTAEGVETAEQLKDLKGLSCEFAQGYYFDKPLSLEDARAILQVRTRAMEDTPALGPIGQSGH